MDRKVAKNGQEMKSVDSGECRTSEEAAAQEKASSSSSLAEWSRDSIAHESFYGKRGRQ